jgi:endonuclease III
MKMSPEIAAKVITTLRKRYTQPPDTDLGNPKDTLLAVLLSARTTDKQVLKIFPAFKKRFPTWESLDRAQEKEIALSINTIGLYLSKAKAIKGLAHKILNEFDGKVPKTMEELVTLPGVGRKTASCVLAYVYNVPAIAVDTHVFRIVHRLGWSKAKNPAKMEEDLKTLVPKQKWIDINRSFVRFGREICIPGTPKCWLCPVARWCAYVPKTPKPE